VGKGIFHTIMCNEESIADFIPVDLVRRKRKKKFECGVFTHVAFTGHKFDGSGSLQNRNNKTGWHDNLQLLYGRSQANHMGSLGVVSNRENEDSSTR
jgi:hypothetical protein